jgi:hypothetical protein
MKGYGDESGSEEHDASTVTIDEADAELSAPPLMHATIGL